MEYEQWSEILSTINADNDLNESNVIGRIKEKLKGKDEGEHEKWERSDCDVNYQFKNEHTLLYWATVINNKKVVELLIKKGANPNLQNNNTPLHRAVEQNRKDLVEVLLKAKGINVNEQSKNGDTPLHYAAGGDHEDVLEVLLTAGANVNAKNKDGKTPLYYACSTRSCRHKKVVI